MEQITELQKFDIPEEIEALDARLNVGMSEEQLADLEYQFKVIYTLDNASKSKAGIQFIKPGTEEAQEIRNVLLKYKMADEVYPFKPGAVAKIVSERSGNKFSVNNNTQAWKLYKVRPRNRAKTPDNTNRDFCVYHQAHKDYTYSEKWITFLVEKISSDEEFDKIKKVRT
jgi:hypothetical protein